MPPVYQTVRQRGGDNSKHLTKATGAEYLMAMTDYVDYGDLKTIFLSLLVCVIWAVIVRTWSNYSLRSIRRRIEESETSKLKLDNIANSDRALIIQGFQALLGVIAIVCMMLALQALIFLGPPGLLALRNLPLVFLWLVPTLVCVGVIITLQQVRDWPKAAEKIDKRIAKLKEKLSGKRG